MMFAGALLSEMTRPEIADRPETGGATADRQSGTPRVPCHVLGREGAAERRPNAEHVEEVRADAHAGEALRSPVPVRLKRSERTHGEPFEGGVPGPEVGDVAWRRRQRIEADPLMDLRAVTPTASRADRPADTARAEAGRCR